MNLESDMRAIFAENLDWSHLKNKTILVTGANGFIGSYIVHFLDFLNTHLSANIKILCNIRSELKTSSRLFNISERKAASFLFANVERISSDSIRDVDIIFHAASQASPVYYRSDPVGTLTPNVIGTYNLLNLVKDKSALDFIFISSGEVYGVVDERPITEVALGYLNPMEVRSCYGESKRMGETICVSFAEQYELNVKIVRPFHTYGPTLGRDDGRVFADFIQSAVHQEDITLTSSGEAYRPFCYITDFLAGLFFVLLRGDKSEAYNIGNPSCEIQIKELALLVQDIVGDINISFAESAQDYIRSPINRQIVDISKVEALGWSPRVQLREGFSRAIALDRGEFVEC